MALLLVFIVSLPPTRGTEGVFFGYMTELLLLFSTQLHTRYNLILYLTNKLVSKVCLAKSFVVLICETGPARRLKVVGVSGKPGLSKYMWEFRIDGCFSTSQSTSLP